MSAEIPCALTLFLEVGFVLWHQGFFAAAAIAHFRSGRLSLLDAASRTPWYVSRNSMCPHPLSGGWFRPLASGLLRRSGDRALPIWTVVVVRRSQQDALVCQPKFHVPSPSFWRLVSSSGIRASSPQRRSRTSDLDGCRC